MDSKTQDHPLITRLPTPDTHNTTLRHFLAALATLLKNFFYLRMFSLSASLSLHAFAPAPRPCPNEACGRRLRLAFLRSNRFALLLRAAWPALCRCAQQNAALIFLSALPCPRSSAPFPPCILSYVCAAYQAVCLGACFCGVCERAVWRRLLCDSAATLPFCRRTI